MLKVKISLLASMLVWASGCLQAHSSASQVANSSYANAHPCGLILSQSGSVGLGSSPRPLTVLAQNVVCGGTDSISAWQALGSGAVVTTATVTDASGSNLGVLMLQGDHTVVAQIGSRLMPIGTLDTPGAGAAIDLTGATATLSAGGGAALALAVNLTGN